VSFRHRIGGCIALDDPDIKELYALVPVGTPVEIRP